MPDLGKKYNCYSCHTKFYDLGKPEPICPKCGADQRDAEEKPVVTSHRGRARIVEEVAEEPEFGPEAETPATTEEEDEEIVPEADREAEPEEEEEEEEY
jgi:hypothetical protein